MDSSTFITIITALATLIGALSPIIVALIQTKANKEKLQPDIGIILPSNVKYRPKTQIRWLVVFSFAFLGGLVGYGGANLASFNPSNEAPTPTVTIAVVSETPEPTFTNLVPTETFTPTPTASQTPTATPTVTQTATNTPTPTPTIPPRVFRGIDNNCIENKYWYPKPVYESDKITLGTNNCWNLSSWGIAANNKTIKFSMQDKDFNERVTRGIFTYIYGKTTTIQFKVKVDALTSAADMDGALFVGLGNDDDYTKPGLFVKFVVPALQKKVFFETGPNYMDYWTPRNDYIFGETLSIKIVIIDSYVTVSVGDSQVRAVNLDATSREVLWIGYTTHSSNNYITADIFDFSIYEK